MFPGAWGTEVRHVWMVSWCPGGVRAEGMISAGIILFPLSSHTPTDSRTFVKKEILIPLSSSWTLSSHWMLYQPLQRASCSLFGQENHESSATVHVLPLIFDVSSVAPVLAHVAVLHISPVIRLLWNHGMSFTWVAFLGLFSATLKNHFWCCCYYSSYVNCLFLLNGFISGQFDFKKELKDDGRNKTLNGWWGIRDVMEHSVLLGSNKPCLV